VPAAVATSISNPVIVRLGRTRPSLLDTISRVLDTNLSGPAEDLTDAQVRFSMRQVLSRIPVLDEVEARGFAPDENNFNVAHDWFVSEVEEEGEFMGWWTFTLVGEQNPEETPEFPIIITDHGPGTGTQTGAIVDGVAAEMPTTFDALKFDERFGDRFMQAKAELIKYKVMNSSVAPDDEINYHPVLITYFSKRVALELIPPGIDYWSRQHKTVTTTGTSEVASYPDMIKSLEKLKVTLHQDCTELWKELQFIVPGLPQRKVLSLPTTDIAGTGWWREKPLTKNPFNTQPLETGGYGWDLALGVFPFP
jgi:hypothetical protein